MYKEQLIKEYDEKAKALRDEFISKLKDDKKEFELTYPRHNEILYCISNANASAYDVYFDITDPGDIKVFEHGLYFNTQKEAEQYLRECKLLFKIKQWAKIKNERWEPNWSDYDNKYVLYYNAKTGFLGINTYNWSNHISVLPTFKTREIAQACINEFREEIKEVLC